jgi:hypothetical protein
MAERVRRDDDSDVHIGISNRESSREEEIEREQFPPGQEGSPPRQDAAEPTGENPLTDNRDRHTSHTGGSRSIVQKESESRYADRSTPASGKVQGAFGREPSTDADPSKDQ